MKTPGEEPQPGMFAFAGLDPTTFMIDAIDQQFE